MVHFGEFLKTWSLRSNSVTRQVSFNKTKIGEKCQNSKIQMRYFELFSNNVIWVERLRELVTYLATLGFWDVNTIFHGFFWTFLIRNCHANPFIFIFALFFADIVAFCAHFHATFFSDYGIAFLRHFVTWNKSEKNQGKSKIWKFQQNYLNFRAKNLK